MSTSPEPPRADDAIVTLLSRWLARHVGDAELRDRIGAIGTGELGPEQAEAVDELLAALREDAPRGKREDARRGELEVAVREALEALALG